MCMCLKHIRVMSFHVNLQIFLDSELFIAIFTLECHNIAVDCLQKKSEKVKFISESFPIFYYLYSLHDASNQISGRRLDHIDYIYMAYCQCE